MTFLNEHFNDALTGVTVLIMLDVALEFFSSFRSYNSRAEALVLAEALA